MKNQRNGGNNNSLSNDITSRPQQVVGAWSIRTLGLVSVLLVLVVINNGGINQKLESGVSAKGAQFFSNR